MPKEHQIREQGIHEKTKRMIYLGLAFVVLAGILLGFIFREQLLAIINPQAEVTPETTQEFVRTEEATPTEIPITPTPTEQPPSPTPIPPTLTAEPIILTLETPIGIPDRQFVIHRVSPGESLPAFADLYNTSVEAILTVNSNILIPLWVDSLIIIPVGFSDVEDLPAFEPYQIEQPNLTPVPLSETLSVNANELSLYNNVPLDYEFAVGDWVLIPRVSSQP